MFMFSKLAYLCIASVLSTQAKDLTGLYRIINPTSGDWARNFPGPGHQGPWLSVITMTTQFSSIYQVGDAIQGFSDGMTKWYIESAGEGLHRVHYPSKDLVWTVQSEEKTLILQPAQGQDTQVFHFDGPF